MKKYVFIVTVCIAVLFSCKKDKEKPVADFKIFVAAVERTDSVPVDTDGYFLFTGHSDEGMVIFYTGTGRPGNNFNNPADTGAVADWEKKVFFRYPAAGRNDTIVCIATIAISTDEIVRDTLKKVIKIY